MSTIRIRDCELHYEEQGRGIPIVFSHGLLWSGRMYDAQVQALSDRYRCITYDHRGQGQSEIPKEKTIDIESNYEDAVALIEALDAKPCHFVGLSMGGFVGLRIAARKPELLRSLILLETSAGPEPESNKPKYTLLNTIARTGLLRLVAPSVMPIMFGKTFLSDPARAEERESWKKTLIGNNRRIYRSVNGVISRRPVLDELGAIKCPTLIMVGDEDVATTKDKSDQMHEGIAGSKLVVIPNAGHSSSIEAPEAVNQAMEQFLGELG